MIRRPPISPLFPHTPLSRSRSATSPPRRIEVVEVMQVVEPQPIRAGIVPVRGIGQRPLDIQEPENVLFNQAPFTQRRQGRSEEHTSELQSQSNLVCRLLLEQ